MKNLDSTAHSMQLKTVLAVFHQLQVKAQLAYNPYSRVQVACLVTDDQGRQAWGVNVENLSYGLTMCAEQVAVGSLISQWGVSKIRVLYLFSPQTNFLLPCGRCRQVLVEHHNPDFRLISFNQTGQKKVYSMSQLMPNHFDLDQQPGQNN